MEIEDKENLRDNYLDAIEGRPTNITTDKKGQRWMTMLFTNYHLAMESSILSSIAKKKSAKEIWDAHRIV